MHQTFRSRLARVWLVTAVVDGLFASTLSVFAYGSTVARLWQGVASTVLGPSALHGGMEAVLIGLLLHAGVALGWSALFLAIAMSSPWIRRIIASRAGIAAVAAVYGPVVWMVMSLAIVPALTGRPPVITTRWWIQLAGHIPFVALPIVAMTARSRQASMRDMTTRPATGIA